MVSVSDVVGRHGLAAIITAAIITFLAADALLLAFILIRRAYRGRYFERRVKKMYALRAEWNAILDGEVSAAAWRSSALSREIVETMALDALDAAEGPDADRILRFLRGSGQLDKRIFEARAHRGWRRRAALVALGRTRAPEAIPALAEALRDPDAETRTAAIRGLGRTGLPQAAVEILNWLSEEGLCGSPVFIQNALLQCCRSSPAVLVPFMQRTEGAVRDLIGRVLSELATPELESELILLAGDPLMELRASAARAIIRARPQLALPVLAVLVEDPEWVVRLRAVVALAAVKSPKAIAFLVKGLCDSNRLVRMRAAGALAQRHADLPSICQQVADTGDRYALQALISQMERTGIYQHLMDTLEHQDLARGLENGELLEKLQSGASAITETAAPPRPKTHKVPS